MESLPDIVDRPEIYGDTLDSRCAFYRTECGLRAHVQPGLQQIMVVASSELAALTVPCDLACRVRDQLRSQGTALGPVINHPRSERWTLLVRADLPTDVATCATLFRAGVALTRPGTQIALPAPTVRPDSLRSWITSPTVARPSASTVAAAILDCANRDQIRR
ncbi:MAG: DNA-directed RNA polymerase subunit beta [Nocardia sp.]|nr:DNA-directed RNA polymerase subunit beta [Nocardia sp.]